MTLKAVADAGPLRYLVLLGYSNVLEALFETVIVPDAVRRELTRDATPARVRVWMESPPEWVELFQSDVCADAARDAVRDGGEGEAIAAALQVQADILVIDDRGGVARARRSGLRVLGTIGVLARGARLGLLDLAEAFRVLDGTNFRWTPALRDRVLRSESERGV